jgi:type VI secretion system protein ImpC
MTDDAVELAFERDIGEPDSPRRGTLPVRLGVLGDFAGDATRPEPDERRFLQVPELASAFAAIRPELHLTLDDHRGDRVPLRLSFTNLDDFSASAIERRFGGGARAEATQEDTGGPLPDQINSSDAQSTSGFRQADQVLGDERFQRLRATWLGLAHVASRCGERVTLSILAARKDELARDLDQAPDLEHAALFRRLYSDVYERRYGVPITALICDYTFSTHPDDDRFLRYLAAVAVEAQTPVIASAAPALLSLDWNDFLPLARGGLGRDFMYGPQHVSWRTLRDSEEMRFVTLALPRWRTRDGEKTSWINAAHALGGQLAAAYERHGWPAALCDRSLATPEIEAECRIWDVAPSRLWDSGLSPIVSERSGGDFILHAPTVHKPKEYWDYNVTAWVRQMAFTRYVLASSRLHQHLLCMARDPSLSPAELASLLTEWLSEHSADASTAQADPRHPLVLEDQVEVTSDGFVSVRVRPAYQLPLETAAKITPPFRVGVIARPSRNREFGPPMASRDKVLLQAVIDDPGNDEPRRHYADRCGDPRRAEMIRCQLEAMRILRSGTPGWGTLATQADRLIRADGKRWAGGITDMVHSYTFHRGFVEEVTLDAASFISYASDLLARAPIRHLNLQLAAPVARELFAMDALDQVVSLNLSRNSFHDEHVIELSNSDHLAALAWLSLSFNKIGREGVEALARSEKLPRLAYVNLNGNPSGNIQESIAVDGVNGQVLSTEPAKLAVDLERQFGARAWFRPLEYGRRDTTPLRGEF